VVERSSEEFSRYIRLKLIGAGDLQHRLPEAALFDPDLPREG
jgi:hypothetical protein